MVWTSKSITGERKTFKITLIRDDWTITTDQQPISYWKSKGKYKNMFLDKGKNGNKLP